jgi:hypothetical protein
MMTYPYYADNKSDVGPFRYIAPALIAVLSFFGMNYSSMPKDIASRDYNNSLEFLEPVEGTVIKEAYDPGTRACGPSDDPMLSPMPAQNSVTQLGSTYFLNIMTEQGIKILVEVKDRRDFPKEALEAMVSPGDFIRFSKSNIDPRGYCLDETVFDDSTVCGIKYADRIELL